MMKVVISSGHGAKVPGCSGNGLEEHDEAVRVVDQTAAYLRQAGVTVVTYEDKVSTTQDENLRRIVDFHNAQGSHDYDVFVHFNESEGGNTTKPIGTECWYMTQDDLARAVASEIAMSSGLIDRGAKYSDGLYVLKHSVAPAILPEICFLNSSADVAAYKRYFDGICEGLAAAITGGKPVPVPPEPEGALFHTKGTCSWFGGPEDDGVSADEGLAFIYDVNEARHLFLVEQPEGTTGLARRLCPEVFYVACRFDYHETPKSLLADPIRRALVRAKGKQFLAWPADWGPHEDTGRVADLSPGLMAALGLETDDEVEIIYPAPDG